MTNLKLYHVSDNGLQEGEALGRISVVLKADYEIEVKRLRTACEKEFESVQMLDNELTKARELLVEIKDYDISHGTQQAIETFLAHQSAPAAKGDKCLDGGTCGLGGFCKDCHNVKD